MPRATALFRDEMLGARPKASLDGLPGLEQRRSPGKASSLRARTKTGPLPTKFLARASSTGCETLAVKSSRFCLERAWQHLFRASQPPHDIMCGFAGIIL